MQLGIPDARMTLLGLYEMARKKRKLKPRKPVPVFAKAVRCLTKPRFSPLNDRKFHERDDDSPDVVVREMRAWVDEEGIQYSVSYSDGTVRRFKWWNDKREILEIQKLFIEGR